MKENKVNELTVEESSEYLEIVRRGNMDEMFDYGWNVGRKKLVEQ